MPGHSKSHNMDVRSGDQGWWDYYNDDTQQVTEEDAKNWLDLEYTKSNRDGSHSTSFPYHTLTTSEMLLLRQAIIERVGINETSRNKYMTYGFDDRTGVCLPKERCHSDGYTGMKPEIADFYKPCYDTDKYSSEREKKKCLYNYPTITAFSPGNVYPEEYTKAIEGKTREIRAQAYWNSLGQTK